MPFPAFFLLAAALGGRESVINRREKNRLLDLEAERQDTINSIDLGISNDTGTNQFDAAQIEAMQRQFQTAQGMLRSKDPKLQSIGANMLQDLDSAVRGNIQQNETEARADFVRLQDQEVLSAGLGKADNEKRFDRELAMNKQVNTELKPFQTARLAYDKVSNLLDNDDQLASLAGLTAFVQAIDNSVVRDAELLKYQGANGMITQFVNVINKSEGRDFDPATKQSIRNAAAALINAEKTRAIAITNSYQDRAVSFGLSPDRVLSGVNENLFTPIQIDNTLQDEREAQADAAEAAFATAPDTFEVIEQTGTERAGASVIAVMEELARNTGILLRGSKLLRDDAGKLFELTKDGDLIPINEAEILRANREAIRIREAERNRLKNETPSERLQRNTPTHQIEGLN